MHWSRDRAGLCQIRIAVVAANFSVSSEPTAEGPVWCPAGILPAAGSAAGSAAPRQCRLQVCALQCVHILQIAVRMSLQYVLAGAIAMRMSSPVHETRCALAPRLRMLPPPRRMRNASGGGTPPVFRRDSAGAPHVCGVGPGKRRTRGRSLQNSLRRANRALAAKWRMPTELAVDLAALSLYDIVIYAGKFQSDSGFCHESNET